MPIESIRWSTFIAGWHRLVDFVFPASCPLCGNLAAKDPFCLDCQAGVVPLPLYACPRCGEPYSDTAGSHHLCQACLTDPPSQQQFYGAGLYEETLRQAIHRLKFDGRLALDHALAHLLHRQLPQTLTPDSVIPVPLHDSRLIERGYNQSQLIAAQLCRFRGWSLSKKGLNRHRATSPQQTLTAEQRRANLQDAFVANDSVAGQCILLVDDVCTTGATLAACSRALSEAGATEVIAVAVARARRQGPGPMEED